jgi:hypothetical protein
MCNEDSSKGKSPFMAETHSKTSVSMLIENSIKQLELIYMWGKIHIEIPSWILKLYTLEIFW